MTTNFLSKSKWHWDIKFTFNVKQLPCRKHLWNCSDCYKMTKWVFVRFISRKNIWKCVLRVIKKKCSLKLTSTNEMASKKKKNKKNDRHHWLFTILFIFFYSRCVWTYDIEILNLEIKTTTKCCYVLLYYTDVEIYAFIDANINSWLEPVLVYCATWVTCTSILSNCHLHVTNR